MLRVLDKNSLLRLAAARENYLFYIDSNGYKDDSGRYNWLVAGGNQDSYVSHNPDPSCWNELSFFLDTVQAPVIPSFLSYDLKNSVENLSSSNPDHTGFPLLAAWVPEWIIGEGRDGNPVHWGNTAPVLADLETYIHIPSAPPGRVEISTHTTREQYFTAFNALQQHISRGDIYEINYCLHFSANLPELDPVELFSVMNQRSPAPFSCLLRFSEQWLLCTSPERFMTKSGNMVIAQPIKGTVRRTGNEIIDAGLAATLKSNPKERAENIMIVDLVRNDLSKIASGKVRVKELCEVYPFATVQQLISTIEAEMPEDVKPADILKYTFPMGSMTGAPKIRAMQLAEEFETFQRRLYSGSVGYFSDTGDFDFNVVIRSITWNKENGYLSFSTGSAVTVLSTADQEFDECQLKVEALIQSLQHS